MTSQNGLKRIVTEQAASGAADPFPVVGAGLRPEFRHQGFRERREPVQAPAAVQGSIIHDFRRPDVGTSEHSSIHMLVSLLLRQRPQEPVEDFLDALATRGVSAEHIYLRLLQPAARRLGEMWLDDICSFVDVTLAVAYLQGGMRHLETRFQRDARRCQGTRAILLTTLGGDQHTFGLTMLAAFFRRAGWTVFSCDGGNTGAISHRLREERNVVVGFSVSRAEQLPALATAIRSVRRLGQQRLAGVLVGGPVFVTRPDLAREAGADAVGFDARSAVAEAEALVSAGECG